MKIYKLFDIEKGMIIGKKLSFHKITRNSFFNIKEDFYIVLAELPDHYLLVDRMDYNKIQETLERILKESKEKDED